MRPRTRHGDRDGVATGASAPTRLPRRSRARVPRIRRCSIATRCSMSPGSPGSRSTDEEVERMSAELSKVLDHIEKIRELDLDGVPPTSHVVDVVNVLRADEPSPCLPGGGARPGARAGRRRLRRSEPRRGVRRADRADARRRRRSASARASSSRGAVRGVPGAGGRRRAERVHMGRRRARRDGRDADGAAGRRAVRGQGPVLHRGRAEPGGLADPRGIPAAVHGDGRREAARTPVRRCSARPTRTSSRWGPRTRTRPSGRC